MFQNATTAGRLLANQIGLLTASDVNWDFYFREPTIRELRIGPGSLRVGKALSEFQGVLTGVPRYNGTAGPLLKE